MPDEEPEATPTASQPFATPDTLALFTRGRIPSSTPFAAEMLAAASKTIRNRCGWHIAPNVEETITVDGRGSSILRLRTLHLTSIEALSEGGTPRTPDIDFEWSVNGVLERHPRWIRKRRGIVATIQHGHELEDVPEIVALACTLAARGLQVAKAGAVVREQAGTNSVTLAAVGGVSVSVDVTDLELSRLDHYRLPARS